MLYQSSLKKPVLTLAEKDVLSPAVPLWGQTDLFQQSFARIFVAYRDARLRNKLAQYQASEGLEVEFLSDGEFENIYGPPPWDFVNSSLKEAGIDFSINQPDLFNYGNFHPVLKKNSNGIEIPFPSLSSGEKILMSFAFCVYHSNDRRLNSMKPELLLLDEIDAPLHPSMSRNIINTITKVIVGEFGIKVMATTHSPSTIAMCPNDSVYLMDIAKPGLTRSSKANALNILTVGVPTIAISYDGRRQVFVESPSDVNIYELLYNLLKPKILSERSLEFIATGLRTPGKGDENTGCDIVKKLVGDLSSAGNISIFGLLDWDARHVSNERVVVLAENERNGLENVLLDPLLIAITICREFSERRSDIGLDLGKSYIDLISQGQEEFQTIVDNVTKRIFGSDPAARATSVYGDSLRLEIDVRCLSTDDHEYERMIIQAFPFLNSIGKNQSGKLMESIISNTLNDRPDLIPKNIIDVFKILLNKPAH